MTELRDVAFRVEGTSEIIDFEKTFKAREVTIDKLIEEVDAAEQALFEIVDRSAHDPAYTSLSVEQQDEVWDTKYRPKIMPFSIALKQAKATLKEGLEDHYRTLEQSAKLIPLPDGKYSTEVVFPTRSQMKTIKLEIRTWPGESLDELLRNVRSLISMEGLHNFGYHPKNKIGFDGVAVRIISDQGFELSSTCWVDGGGQIIKTLRN